MTEVITANVCSQNADIHSFVTFKNTTSRKVDIYWVDYKGQNVKYYQNFSPDKLHNINTYVSHPWMARDSLTNDALLINGKRIFYPPAWDGGSQRVLINIHSPVFQLKKICIQILKDLFPKQDIPDLEIPRHLIEEMREKPPHIKYTEYNNMERD